MNPAFLLHNTIQDYDWGHPRHIRDFIPSGEACPPVQAEMWMGAHPKASSRVRTTDGPRESLRDLIAQDPAGTLGASVLAQGYRELPFLFKLLAAAKPLSIQCHPNMAQAREGFAREEAQAVPLQAPHRNYKDPFHKPEIIVALTPFQGLGGFRPADEIAKGLRDLARSGPAEAEMIRPLELMADLAEARDWHGLVREASQGGPQRADLARWIAARVEGRDDETSFQAHKAAKAFPGDGGILFFWLLNLLSLQPGEAFYAPPGVLHAYLSGFGMELMANSDNVLRCGLTPKHIDQDELLAILDPTAVVGPLKALNEGGELCYRSPAREFELRTRRGEGNYTTGARAEIVLCTEGWVSMELEGDGGRFSLELARGESAFLGAGVNRVTLGGGGTLARALIPRG